MSNEIIRTLPLAPFLLDFHQVISSLLQVQTLKYFPIDLGQNHEKLHKTHEHLPV